MFKSILETDFFEQEITNAKNTIIKKDRLQYQPIFDKIKQELSKDDTVVFSDLNKIIGL